MSDTFQSDDVIAAIQRACAVVSENTAHLTELDQAMGDGDMGITTGRIAEALQQYVVDTPADDLGAFLSRAGMTANRAGPSTMGTLIATALMRAGKAVKGKPELTPADLAAMFAAADQGMQERGKAKPGDKTIIDAIHPAAETFTAAIDAEETVAAAGAAALAAAEAGRDSVTPLRSKIGRAGWVGERTEGKVDPGCALFTLVLGAVVNG